MNNSVTLLLIFVLLTSIYAGNSYGAIAPREDPSLYEVSLQLALRNSEGQLVAYVEPNSMFIRNLALTHEFLDTINNKTTITIDGKNYEQIQFQKTGYFSKGGQKTAYGLVYKGIYVILLMHDAYIAQPGDILTVSWKIIRTPL